MRGLRAWVLAMTLAVGAGCGKREMGAARLSGGSQALPGTALEASQTTYRYAFSGQILDGNTGKALPDFGVSLLSEDGSLSALVNSMGGKNGVFHISRNPHANDSAVKSVKLLITAVSHKPLVQLVQVGADCLAGQCPGMKPVPLRLAPADSPSFARAAFAPLNATQHMASVSPGVVFQELLQSGKLDPEIQKLFGTAKNGDILGNVLVILNSAQGADLQQLLSGASSEKLKALGLFSGAASVLVPLLTTTAPDVSSALAAANLILPYLGPILNHQVDGKSSPLASILTTLLADPSSQQNLTSLIQAIARGDKKQTVQFAMATLLPLLQGLVGKKAGTTANPFENLLLKSVMDPKFFSLISSLGSAPKDQKLSLLLGYLQPLVQAMGGKTAPEVAYLFNLLLQDGGIEAIKSFPKDSAAVEKFAQLVPFLEPLVRGLNGSQGAKLAEALAPILSSANPAAAVRDLLFQATAGGAASGPLISGLLPALAPLLSESVPGKQLLSSQLLQGLLNGDFASLQVTKDLQGFAAVVVSGQARDIFKLAQLPNVEKVVALTP